MYMKTKLWLTMIFLGLGMFIPVSVLAGGFNLRSIGGVSTNNQQLSHWWHTSSNPVLRGEASPGADVVITIDSNPIQISADSAGDWVYSASDLSQGDHSVSLESGGSTIDFTLTIGSANVDWSAVEAGGQETLPTVGIVFPGLILMGSGSFLALMGKKLLK